MNTFIGVTHPRVVTLGKNLGWPQRRLYGYEIGQGGGGYPPTNQRVNDWGEGAWLRMHNPRHGAWQGDWLKIQRPVVANRQRYRAQYAKWIHQLRQMSSWGYFRPAIQEGPLLEAPDHTDPNFMRKVEWIPWT
jgi:hypothetical protein